MKYFVGIDIGGTNISTGVVDETYKIVGRQNKDGNRKKLRGNSG